MALLQSIQNPEDLKRLSIDQLPELAAEIRAAIVEQISRSGGHLAPNLGVVELTIAMHYVFDFGHDRLLFDVGHQCYPHKLLTGRLPLLGKLRTREGMAGFPEPRESRFDLFSVGHAGTAISTAVGMARGDLLNKDSFDPKSRPDGRRVVSLIGDASIVNGVAMEGLNNAGTLRRQFLVVLNDNGMSISHPQGAMAQYFDRLRINPYYADLKRTARKVLDKAPGGKLIEEAYHRMGEATKAMLAQRAEAGPELAWFEHFGLVTVGPIDGHDIPTLVEFLAEAREFDRPMVLHVKTIKGKGIAFAEGDAEKFHSPAAFIVKTDPDSPEAPLTSEGCRVELKSGGRSFTKAFSDAIEGVMTRDEKVVACTAAMPDGTGMSKVMRTFPERTWDTGICESHAMDMMAGLAKSGFRPFFAVYSTFLQRAFDQAFQEVSLQGLAVRLCLDRAGLVGGDGAVHHGFCDVALLRTLPGAVITAAIDEPSLVAALEFMRTHDDGLSAVRYPRENVCDTFAHDDCPAFEFGKARALIEHDEPDAAVLVFGALAEQAKDAIDSLGEDLRVSLYDARFAKPVDDALIRSLLERRVPVVTVEDHSAIGGFGAAVLESAAAQGLDASRVRVMGLPDAWIHQDSRAAQLTEAGLDAPAIAAAIRASVRGGARMGVVVKRDEGRVGAEA
ncbi:MAG: 1-deoxy-D-xylulose-5-phosphate synthase [Phycisphaerales bacterium]|nr:MAG: 1-deoxy-D-xylulose-5-phosphate synthase [Phycisphaerales bacterium]